jgi:hypothetical protein
MNDTPITPRADNPLFHPEYGAISTDALRKQTASVDGVERQRIEFELIHRQRSNNGPDQ